MLLRVSRILREAVEPVVVVASAGQQIPQLPPEVAVVRDRHQGRGPLEGLAAGLRALAGRAEAAYVTGCDVPLLRPQFVRRLFELAAGYDIAVPHVGGFDEPLAAVYRTALLPQVESLLAIGLRRPALMFDRVRTRRITPEEFADVDPDLHSLANVNSPADYRNALQKAGLAAAPEDSS